MPMGSIRSQPPPAAIRRLVEQTGAQGTSGLRRVELRQSGTMRQDRGTSWMQFQASQSISLQSCAFHWRARTGPAGSIQVSDAFENGIGTLSVKLLGLFPIAGARRSADLDRGEILRYLAELPWAPDAILLNPELEWRVQDDAHLVVSAGQGPRRADVALTLDARGLIVEAAATDRPRALGNAFVPGPWRGVFSDYAECEGRQVPMSAEVGWGTRDEFEPVWRGRIVDWRTA